MLDFYLKALDQNESKVYLEYYGDDVESYVRTTLKLVDDLIQHLNTDDKILEIGCGDGIALHYLRMHGYDCRGIDKNSWFPECHDFLDVSEIVEKKEILRTEWLDCINNAEENVVFSLRFYVFDEMHAYFNDNIKYVKDINKTFFVQVSPLFEKSNPNIYNYLQENAVVKNKINNSFLLK